MFIYMGPPTWEHIWPGEISTEGPENARALGKWPKFFKNHCAENPRKFSRGITTVPLIVVFLICLRAQGTHERAGYFFAGYECVPEPNVPGLV